ncbi:hypothetical protein SAMN05428989_2546 [Pseudoxanthomonas sp. GM95]|uniref:DUF6348 family protein n=1 Tax=Pseudoxanthomonas sp. GM95 TaxID=1881043 RepID=UPI0008BD3358|nr:DUF6348 family protein [Pseudoxanthomonas sp. GM95]SEL80048.1 hypothetical protein SAMN05428989_2546 [Pseudoxanthomonas sp. GM95]
MTDSVEGAQSLLQRALAAHGITASAVEGVFHLQDGLRLTPLVHEMPSRTEDFVVSLEVLAESPLLQGTVISERFAGLAADKAAAVAQAFEKFLLGVFHVMLEALSSHVCEAPQAEIERWQGVDGRWRVYSGPLLTQHSSNSVLSGSYGEALKLVQREFERGQRHGPHWVRVFIAAYHGQIQAAEVLLDNQNWTEGLGALDQISWHASEEYQAIRHFLVALPDTSSGSDF